MTLIHLMEENLRHGSDNEIRQSHVSRCFSVLVPVTHFVFYTQSLVSIMSHYFQMVLCVTSAETQHFSEVLFGSISDELAAFGSTILPNCSFSILCLFSDCQNTRMCNQGWALDEARQISQQCRPSLLCG